MTKSVILFSLLAISILCLFSADIFQEVDIDEKTIPHFDSADTAWMLVSSAMVLIMTPGLGFFMEVW